MKNIISYNRRLNNIKSDNVKLFIYTVDEYKRFSFHLNSHVLTDEYDEKAYTDIHIKLMLLRKYATNKENLYIGTVIKEAISEYPEKKEELELLLKDYDKIEKQQLEHILSDGTKLNLYQTIEDVMYGMYLHADKNRINRINRLKQTDENLRFICVRKYVEDLEQILFKLYNYLKKYEEYNKEEPKERASVIYLGDNIENKQEIKNSPYWMNLYGHDGNDEDLRKIARSYESDEFEIQCKCMIFLNELKKDNMSISLMDNLIFPATKKDWGDYLEARSYYKKIENPGISTKIRYNEAHNMAYVRIFPKVDDAFIIKTPHIINELYEICLVKDNEKTDWKIYSIGGHLDSYILNS